MDLDVTLLSRIQFAFTVSFHIIFPTLSLGLALLLAIIEGLWLKTGKEVYYFLYRFWVKIFALTFGMGVVSGIVLSFEFGTNFSRFAEFAGPVLGPLISVEVLTAFFLEAGFLGVMLFGWTKVGPRLHFVATLLVMLGTMNSAFWIIAANSWMHTPAGVVVESGRVIVESWWEVIFNPSFPYRYFHMLFASYLTAASVMAGISAWYLLKHQHISIAKKGLSIGLLGMIIFAPTQAFIGDMSGLQVLRDQPAKIAAMEGIWETKKGVPLLLFAIPNEEQERNDFEIGIPNLASLILTHDIDGEIKGLKELAPEDRPNVPIVFWSFRLMVGSGILLILVAVYGLYCRYRHTLYSNRYLHMGCVAVIPLGFIATLAGWFTAEVGRQPYTVQGLLRTADSVSPIEAYSVAVSLTLFVVVYTILFIAYLYYMNKLLRKGPRYDPPIHQVVKEIVPPTLDDRVDGAFVHREEVKPHGA